MSVVPGVGSANQPLVPSTPGSEERKTRLHKAASDFEAIWIHQMLKEAQPKGGMLERSFAAETYRDMLSQTLAQSMAKRGAFGLADALVKQVAPPNSEPPPAAGDVAAEGK